MAAYRHRALTHHRAVRAHKRSRDLNALLFDAEQHGGSDPGFARLFDDPRDHVVAEDWLAELDAGPLRDLWRSVLVDGRTLKEAGDALGLTKPAVTKLTRDGRRLFERFAELSTRGVTCSYRASAVRAFADGTASDVEADRARAHLACCLPCALVHDPAASAISRGLFGALPLPVLLLRLRDVLAERAGGAVGTFGGAGGAKVAAGLAALTVAGATGLTEHHRDVTRARREPEVAPSVPAIAPARATPSPAVKPAGLARAAVPAATTAARISRVKAVKRHTTKRRPKPKPASQVAPPVRRAPTPAAPVAAPSAPAAHELSPEVRASAPAAPTSPAPSAAAEFGRP